MEQVAELLVNNGVSLIRGGAFKPRKSPFSFQGMGKKGLEILGYIRQKYQLRVITEIIDPRDLEMISQYADILQIGSRNMDNYALLKEVGRSTMPVILKRGYMSTFEEFSYAAQYIFMEGNQNVILCERGIRTFENATRNTLDLSSVALLKKESNINVIVDISHSLGRTDIMLPISKAVAAVGADGIMVEVHPTPSKAL
mgnify:FL=1